MNSSSHKLPRSVLKPDANSKLIEERIAYASKYVVEVQLRLKSNIIIPICVVVSEFDPNESTWFDAAIPNVNGASKRIQVSDISSFVILNLDSGRDQQS